MESAERTGNEIVITASHLEKEAGACRELINRLGVPALLSAVAPGAYGTTGTNLAVLGVLEESGALFLALAGRLGAELPGSGSPGKSAFAGLYALALAAGEGAEAARRIAGGAVNVKGTLDRSFWRKHLEDPPDALVGEVIEDYRRYLSFYRNHADPAKRLAGDRDVAGATAAYFRLLANTLLAESDDPGYAPFKEALARKAVGLPSARWQLFARMTPGGEESPLLPLTPDDIVGNREYLEAALRLARDTAGFDFTAGKNPKSTNPVLFALGRPGCGKTATAHAVGNYFLRYCRERNVPAGFVVIRRTDWASSYQNASAQQLLAIFREKVEAAPGVVGVYWPDIDTAFAAREEPGVRSEERNILGALFGIFDGTLLPRNGKWFMLCDANYMQMDEAAISRITQDPYYIRGVETPEDCLALLRDRRLRDYRDFLMLDDGEWLTVGERCVQYDFSGREIENLSRNVISKIENFEYPDSYFAADWEERRRLIRSLSKSVDAAALLAVLDAYHRFEKAAEEKAARKRFEDRVRELSFNLKAEALARSQFG